MAAELLRAKQYRYLSPVALVRRGDRRMVGLHSIALTNKPAIVGMRPVVASETAPPIRVAIDEPPALARLRKLVALEDAAGADDVLAAAADRIASLEQEAGSRAAEDRVARASAAGKLAPCQRDWALALALRDPVAFDGWLAAAPMVVPLGQTEPPDAEDSSGALHAVERCARREYRQHVDVLGRLCSEEAYIADARRRG